MYNHFPVNSAYTIYLSVTDYHWLSAGIAKRCPQCQRKRTSRDLAINAAHPPLLVQSSAQSVTANMSNIRNKSATSQNPSYQRDIRYVFKLNNWILSSLGIWPVAIRGIGQHVSKIAIAICNLALSFAIVPCALHIVYDEKDLILKMKLCGLLAFCLTAMTKYCILVIRRPKIHRCIEYLKNDWWQVSVISNWHIVLICGIRCKVLRKLIE